MIVPRLEDCSYSESSESGSRRSRRTQQRESSKKSLVAKQAVEVAMFRHRDRWFICADAAM